MQVTGEIGEGIKCYDTAEVLKLGQVLKPDDLLNAMALCLTLTL